MINPKKCDANHTNSDKSLYYSFFIYDKISRRYPLLYIIFTCPPLPHLIVGGESLYRIGDIHLRRIMPRTFDLIFVTSGTLYMEENGAMYTVKAGQFIILPPRRLHKGYRCCDSETDFYWLHFYTAGDFICADKPIYDKNHKQKANYQFEKEPFHISLPQYGTLSLMQQAEMAECMNAIVQVRIDKKLPKKAFLSSTVSQIKSQQLFFSILSLLCDIPTGGAKDTAQEIYEHFATFYREPFDLKKLAEFYAFHPTHIIRCVKKKYGMTPLQLLLSIRIQKAREMLIETDLAINKIAFDVGFEDNTYFAKQFKNISGMTPSEYRRKGKEQL